MSTPAKLAVVKTRSHYLTEMSKTLDKLDALLTLLTEADLNKTPGARVDDQYAMRETKRRLSTLADSVDGLFKVEDDKLADLLTSELDLESISGKLATFSLGKPVERPRVKDWEAFLQWIQRRKALHCLQRRISEKALLEEMDSMPKPPPGIEKYEDVKTSLRTR